METTSVVSLLRSTNDLVLFYLVTLSVDSEEFVAQKGESCWAE